MFILEAIAAFGNWFWGLPILFLIVGGGICHAEDPVAAAKEIYMQLK